MADDPNALLYRRDVFEVHSMEEAKRIVLTSEDSGTEERWQRETPYLGDCIVDFLAPDDKTLLLDYGCGIGRISKELIGRSGCSVVGVDISHSMRQLAPAYVTDTRFAVCAWAAFDALAAHGTQVDGAIAIWSLQHSPWAAEDIERIKRVLKPGGKLFVCNLVRSAVPTNKGWADIGFDIRDMLAGAFETLGIDAVSREHTSVQIAANAFLGRYRKAAA